MPKALGSRRFAFLALAAFLLAQPVVGCAALCLLQRHHGQHEMGGMTGGAAAGGASACHTGVADADRHAPVQSLSPMEPSLGPVVAALPTESLKPPVALPGRPAQVSHTVEPPPPRSV